MKRKDAKKHVFSYAESHGVHNEREIQRLRLMIEDKVITVPTYTPNCDPNKVVRLNQRVCSYYLKAKAIIRARENLYLFVLNFIFDRTLEQLRMR